MKRSLMAAALAASIALAGCTALQNFLDGGGGTAELGVTYATLKYIDQAGSAEQQVARALKVRQVAEEVQAAARGDSITVAMLQAYVMGKLPPDLDPADRYLVSALVASLASELQERIGEGVLDPEKLLVVDALLGWVVEATTYYAPAPA